MPHDVYQYQKYLRCLIDASGEEIIDQSKGSTLPSTRSSRHHRDTFQSKLSTC
ncbi:hypothetical protein SK128_001510, partial [Halocaridina rubra]